MELFPMMEHIVEAKGIWDETHKEYDMFPLAIHLIVEAL
jgi:hypothetical protein